MTASTLRHSGPVALKRLKAIRRPRSRGRRAASGRNSCNSCRSRDVTAISVAAPPRDEASFLPHRAKDWRRPKYVVRLCPHRPRETDCPTARGHEYRCNGSWLAAESDQARHAADRARPPPCALCSAFSASLATPARDRLFLQAGDARRNRRSPELQCGKCAESRDQE